MIANNEYYRLIAELVTHTETDTGYSDNYYLTLVAEEYGYTYGALQCKGKLLKDITEYICDTEITGNHTNIYYLVMWANELLDNPILVETENNCLKAIYENIDELTKKSTNLNMVAPSHIVYTDDFIITGTLTDTSGTTPVPMENSNVKLYIGNTEVDSDYTDENGEVEFTSTPAHMGTHTFKLKYNGTLGHKASESSTATVTVDKETSILSLSSPSSGESALISDNITVNGLLVDDDLPTGNPVTGKTVTVYNDLIYKRSSSGLTVLNQTLASSYKFSNYTGSLIIGDFQSTGNAISFGSNYFMILQGAVVVSEVTGLSNISVSVNGNVITVNGTNYDLTQYNIDLTKLYSLEGGSVIFYGLNGGVIDTYTTGSDGSFTDSISASDIGLGEHSLSFVFDGDEYYTGSSINRTVTVSSFDDIVLSKSSGYNPLSYVDSQTCTVSAQLQYNGSDVTTSGVSVLFYDYTDSSNPVYLGSDTTDSNGQAEYTYTSQGVGDVDIKAVSNDGMILSETYTVEDCTDYDPCTSNSGKWTIPSGVTSVYDSNGWKVSANAYKQIKLTDKLTTNCSVEFTLVDYLETYGAIGPSVILYQYTNGETTPNQMIMSQSSDTAINVLGTTINRTFVKGAKYRIEYTSSTLKVYENDTLLAQGTNNIGLPTRFEFHEGANSRYIKIKDVKVKPL